MNRYSSVEENKKSIFNYLDQMGGWPVLKKDNEWNENLFNWPGNIIQLPNNTYWLTHFFLLRLNGNFHMDTRKIINLRGSPEIFNHFSFDNLNDQCAIDYLNYMVNMSVALGAEYEHAKNELTKALDFGIKLSNLSNHVRTDRRMTLGELEKKYPYFEWKNYINYQLSYSNMSIDDNEEIFVNNVEYFDQLNKLMETTPKKIQANLAIWSQIQIFAGFFDEKILNVVKNASENSDNCRSYGHKTYVFEPKKKECSKMVDNIFPIATRSLYVREYIKKDLKDNMVSMVKNIHNQFIKLLNNISWMDEQTKSIAIDKFEKIKYFILYPDELLNDTKIAEYHKTYNNLEFNNKNFFENFMSILVLYDHTQWNEIKQIYIPNEWENFAGMISKTKSNYDPYQNSFVLPAGIFQHFDNDLPKYMSYSAIGGTVGFDIINAFDYDGKDYDADGNYAYWWSDYTNEQYKTKVGCIYNQDIHNTNENTASCRVLKAIYSAYNDWLIKDDNYNDELKKISPEYDFNPRQMFWISYADTYRYKYFPDTTITESQINIPLSNLEEFSRDFQCPIGSKMNREKKCNLW